jgi:hypothetical protein
LFSHKAQPVKWHLALPNCSEPLYLFWTEPRFSGLTWNNQWCQFKGEGIMKTELRVIGLLLALTAVAMADMRTWTFEKSGKTIKGEVVSFAGETVTLKLDDGKTFAVPIAYLTKSNRVDLTIARAKQWKEVDVVKVEGSFTASDREKICAVEGREVKGKILIRLLPASVEQILRNRDAQAARIAQLSNQIESQSRAVARADATTPTGAAGDPGYVSVIMAQRQQVNLAALDLDDARNTLAKLDADYAEYMEKTKFATIVKIKNTGVVFQGLPVWECPDPRKPQ